MGLFLVERRDAVGQAFAVRVVQAAGWIHAQQLPHIELSLIPLPTAVCAQGRIQHFELLQNLFVDLEPEGLVTASSLILTLICPLP
jgi:hypothetical protein